MFSPVVLGMRDEDNNGQYSVFFSQQ